jgi:hypothetical protein
LKTLGSHLEAYISGTLLPSLEKGGKKVEAVEEQMVMDASPPMTHPGIQRVSNTPVMLMVKKTLTHILQTKIQTHQRLTPHTRQYARGPPQDYVFSPDPSHISAGPILLNTIGAYRKTGPGCKEKNQTKHNNHQRSNAPQINAPLGY